MFEFGVEFDSIKGRSRCSFAPRDWRHARQLKILPCLRINRRNNDLLGKTMLPLKGEKIFVGSKTLGEKQSFSRWQNRVMQLYKVFKKGFGWRKYVFFFQRLFISFFGSFESTLEQPDVLLFRFGKLCSEATWLDGMNVWYSHGLA